MKFNRDALIVKLKSTKVKKQKRGGKHIDKKDRFSYAFFVF